MNVRVSGCVGDFGDAALRIAQQLQGLLHAEGLHILIGALSEGCFEGAGKVEGGKAGDLGHVVNGDLAGEAVVNEGLSPMEAMQQFSCG